MITTIKNKQYQYITSKLPHRYPDMLQDFVKNYNITYRRTIEMASAKVTKADESNLQ